MSLKVFYQAARNFPVPRGLRLGPYGLVFEKKAFYEIKPLRKLSLPGRLRAAERTSCNELFLLTDQGLFEGKETFGFLFRAEGADTLAVFDQGIFLVGREIRLLAGPRWREIFRFPGPKDKVLSATVRRKRLYLLTEKHELLTYSLRGREITRVKAPSRWRALKAFGPLWAFDGQNLIQGKKIFPLSRPLREVFFLPGPGGPWFLSPEGDLFWGERKEEVPADAQAKLTFRLEEGFSQGLLLILGQGDFEIGFPHPASQGPIAKVPSYENSLEVHLRLRGKEMVFSGVLVVPGGEDFLRLWPEAYREGAEEFLLPFLSAFKLLYEALLKRKEEFFEVFWGQGEGEDLLFLARLLGLSLQGLSDEELLSWLSALPTLYRYRGTVRGMKEVIRLVAKDQASLREAILWREIEDEEGPFSRLFGRDGRLFAVFSSPSLAPEKVALLREVVRDWMPLGTKGEVYPLDFGFTLGQPLALGINTALKDGAFRLGCSRLGQDSRLQKRSIVGRLDLQAALNRDAQI